MTLTLVFLIQAMLLQRGMGFLSVCRTEICAFMISLEKSTFSEKEDSCNGKSHMALRSREAYTLLSKCNSFF
jgi:hypothetical protein